MSDPSPPASCGAAQAPRAGRAGRPSRLRRLFGIDRRSLAAFRVSFGILLLADVIKRALALRAHYTDAGVMPREALQRFLPDPLVFQAYLWSGETWYAVLLFGVAAFLALCVTVGWHAQLATLIYLWLQVSVRLRNPFANHTGDDYLTAIIFFAAFLPLSCHLSLARLRRPALPVLPPVYLSVGSAAILLQVAAFYVGAGLDKHHFEVWRSGEAVSWFAHIDQYTTPIGERLIDYPGLCRFGTYFTLALEIGGPILLFSPFFTPLLRTLIVLLLVGFHLGIQAVVYIGIFELLSIAAAILFLPGEFWDFLGRLQPLSRLGRALSPLARASPGAPPYRRNVVPEVVAGLAIAVVLYSNAYASFPRQDPDDPTNVIRRAGPLPRGGVSKITRLLSLRQSWQIFSELDKPVMGWFLVLGSRPDGSLIDLWNERPFQGDFRKPPGFASNFPNHNWRRYWNQMRFEDKAFLRPHLCDYLIRTWNAAHPDQAVESVVILLVDAKGGAEDPKKRQPLVRYQAARGLQAASWWLPATRFTDRISR